MKNHFVTFYSPGTFISEQTTEPIESWNVEEAVERSKQIVERYNSRPFGFRFSTRERDESELDSREITRSPMYHLGGTVLTLQQVKDRNDPKDEILIKNMECNGFDRIIENCNSWKSTQPLYPEDVVLDVSLDS